MILIGLDDTDIVGSPGTNQLARRIAGRLPPGHRASIILRHQLLFDPRIPYTSQNGSASIGVEVDGAPDRAGLLHLLRREIREWFVEGSDPGLCLAERVPAAVVAFGRWCQREPVTQAEAREVAREAGLHLEGLGGTEDGVIGALAAVGLLAGGDDGRVVHRPGWVWPDDFTGPQPVGAILDRGVDAVRDRSSGRTIDSGAVDIGKHLRPSYRAGQVVLFVEPAEAAPGDPGRPEWRAVKLP